jgi:aspartate carbamoyltransferase catalytic subunit
MQLRHVVESQQFTVPLLMDLFNRAKGMERVVARRGTLEYQGRILVTLFYEPSTRTRFSFESAMMRLGGGVLSTEQARIFSSAVEGEEVEDSIRTLAGYCDVIVIRHHQAGGAERAARVSPVPLINAGEAGGQHPTQALLDLYTIYRRRSLDGLAVAFVGELDRGRTARSLAYLLAKFERIKIWFVSPPEMQMQPDILQYLERHGVAYELADDINQVVGEVDVVYQTRIQPDRASGLRVPGNRYTIDSSVLPRMRPDAMILHPLPRTVELDRSVDDDPRALYFQQATNGLYVRMALLTLLLDGE